MARTMRIPVSMGFPCTPDSPPWPVRWTGAVRAAPFDFPGRAAVAAYARSPHQVLSLDATQGLEHAQERRREQDHEQPGEDAEHEREHHLDPGLVGLLLGALSASDSKRVRLGAKGGGDTRAQAI